MPKPQRIATGRTAGVSPSPAVAAAAPPVGRLDRWLHPLERGPGRAVAILLVPLAMMLLAMARVSPGFWPTYLGKSYAELSLAPFSPDPTNPVAYRILTPLISYVIGLRGRWIVLTNLLIAAALLALVYDWLRRKGHPAGNAILAVSTLALSMVTLTTVHYGGYCDSLTYLLIFLIWCARERLVLVGALFYLALLNRESVGFLAPWVVFAHAAASGFRRSAWLGGAVSLLAACGLFLATRQLLAAHTPGVEYSATYYLQPLLRDPLYWYRISAEARLLGIFSVYNLYWVFPILAVIHLLRRGDRVAAAAIVLPFVCAYAQLLVAYDTSRMLTLSFMGVLLGAEYLLRTDAFRAREWAAWLAVANFFVPQVNVAGGVVAAMR